MNRRVYQAFLLAGVWLFAACNSDFDPPSQVKSFRLLAVKAETPEIASPLPSGVAPGPYERPADHTKLTALVSDPAYDGNPGKRSTVIYFACTPDPNDPLQETCTSFDQMRDPVSMITEAMSGQNGCAQNSMVVGSQVMASGQGVVGGISFVGMEACDANNGCVPATITVPLPLLSAYTHKIADPVYTLPANMGLDALPASSPFRTTGVQVVILAFALDAAPEEFIFAQDALTMFADPCKTMTAIAERLKNLFNSRAHVDAVKRLVVRGPDAAYAPNQNPAIEDISCPVGDLPQSVKPRQEVELFAKIPADNVFAQYGKYDSQGKLINTAQEEWIFSWFTTAGELDKDSTLSDPMKSDKWTAPDGSNDQPLPTSGKVRLYVVARDSRGGINWATKEVTVSP